jgi:hypothetical protein
LKPKRELKERLGEARREYVVDKEPVMGVRVKVNVYGKVEMGVGWLVEDEEEVEDGTSVAAGSVLNRRPVDMPIIEETGE